jgi:predicted MPP superfamily phosphohydrolase
MIYLLLALAAVGHVVFWAALVNRLHGLGIDRRWIDAATAACGLAMAAVPLAIAAYLWQRGVIPILAWAYLCFCAVYGVASAVHRIWLAMHPERRGALHANHTSRVDLKSPSQLAGEEKLTAAGIPTWLSRVPGNQVLDLTIHEKRLAIPRMPAGSELRIVHISDLHMSGRLTKAYFQKMVAKVNELQPDLVAITGDLVERDRCMAWLPDTLGQLRAASGVYFVLGNHDRRVDHQRLLAALADAGITHLGGTWQLVTIRDTPVLLGGNELPWFRPAPNLADAPVRNAAGVPLRVLLAHAPDQFTWARKHDFDLVLAGHNHGGQVRLPIVGAILAPSLSGTRYACGAFRRGNTVLHVSRGTGSHTPFRWSCPPEIALLILGAEPR